MTNDKENAAPDPETLAAEKTEADIQQDIQALFRQITASVTFLPMGFLNIALLRYSYYLLDIHPKCYYTCSFSSAFYILKG